MHLDPRTGPDTDQGLRPAAGGQPFPRAKMGAGRLTAAPRQGLRGGKASPRERALQARP